MAVAAFLLAPGSAPAWLAIASTFVLGFGLGLLSVCTIVGPQATVQWHQRGVVTGSVMFSRYLGQSLGAAIFGAIFNAVLAERLRAAPTAFASKRSSPHRGSDESRCRRFAMVRIEGEIVI